MKISFIIFYCFCLFIYQTADAQDTAAVKQKVQILSVAKDTLHKSEKDIVDFLHPNHEKEGIRKGKPTNIGDDKYHISLVPAVGYTLQTGFAGILSANLAYKTDAKKDTKLSNISTSLTYSQYNQVIIPVLADIWTKGNKFNFISDNRFIKYPSSIYGLGGRVDPNKGHTINFSGLKLHETVLASVIKNVYAGVGIYYDQFWNISVIDSATRRTNLLISRELGTSETAIGFTLRLLYDSRLNQINPENGWYVNTVYRNNQQFMGSDQNWRSLLIDVRKYFHFPARSKNVIALWAMNWLTLDNTKPPYLLLPSTGWDDQYNTGRGYIQGRFRGNNMYYYEAEYRYRITRNGLLGGVVFGNMQKFSGELSQEYTTLQPGYGLGLRLKLNKHSNTNLCIDYGFGNNGSKGFFVNLGEVF